MAYNVYKKSDRIIKIGCCGFPAGRQKYYEDFKVVEIQQTFYQPPGLETVKRWRDSAPGDFEFTLKAWQLITHEPTSPTYRKLRVKIKEKKKSRYGFFKPTDEVLRAYDLMSTIATQLRTNIIVFQSPVSFKPDKKNLNNLKKFFKLVKRRDFRFVWEPRGDWPSSIIERLCKELNLIHCVDPFKSKSLYGDIRYFRLHGITGYRYKYSDPDLSKLKRLCTKDRVTYVMFNNVYMYNDAINFKRLQSAI